MEYLNKQQEGFCENAGLFGLLISLACLIQHMIFMTPGWITILMIAVYVFCITGFILLMKKYTIAPLLLAIGGGLILLLEILMTISLAFSLVLVLLLLYLIVIVAILYGGNINNQLKKRSIAIKQEDEKWNNVL